MFLGPIIWPPAPEVQPTQAQLPYLIVLSVIEALTTGFGIAFIAYGWPLKEKAGEPIEIDSDPLPATK